jgi:hypothetical protein
MRPIQLQQFLEVPVVLRDSILGWLSQDLPLEAFVNATLTDAAGRALQAFTCSSGKRVCGSGDCAGCCSTSCSGCTCRTCTGCGADIPLGAIISIAIIVIL